MKSSSSPDSPIARKADQGRTGDTSAQATHSPDADPDQRRALKVGFILVPRFTLLAFAGFIDTLRLAADEADRSRQIDCTWTIIGEPGRPIRASCGLTIMPDETYGDPARFDYVVVVGGVMHGGQQVPDDAVAFLRHAAQARKPLIGLCTGSFVLARAGLLDGYRSCVNWFHHLEFSRAFPTLSLVSDQMYIVDRDRMTCAGGTSVIHLAAYIIERHLGRAQATKSLRIMIEDTPLPPQTPQPPAMLELQVSDPLVRRAVLLMEQALDSPRTVEWLAKRVGIGVRQLERRFRVATGSAPREFAMRLRLSHARWLVVHTERQMTVVALECGFADASHFARCFRHAYGASPATVRSSATAERTVGRDGLLSVR
jgi:transcriptional regulator GlxA family with amidase domain